jgi:hypothetical protein
MGGMFGGGKSYTPSAPPPPPAPAPAPTIDNARQERQSQDEVIARRGRAASILTSTEGDLSTPTTGTKQLLGA